MTGPGAPTIQQWLGSKIGAQLTNLFIPAGRVCKSKPRASRRSVGARQQTIIRLAAGEVALGSSAERLVEPACELRLVPGGVVGVNDTLAGGAVKAGACQRYGLLRRFLIALSDGIGCLAAKSLQAAAH